MRPIAFLAPFLSALLPGFAGALSGGDGFEPGELYLSSSALVRVDPFSGATQLLVDYVGYTEHGTASYDPFRGRLLVSAGVGGVTGLWAFDPLGAGQLLVANDRGYRGIAPTGDGRVYLSESHTSSVDKKKIRWLDAAGGLHWLLDGAGQVFEIETSTVTTNLVPFELLYDPPTNSLIAATSESEQVCPAGAYNTGINLRRIPLDAAGTHVAGPVECVQLDLGTPSATDRLRGLSRGPDGRVMVGIGGNSGTTKKELWLLDTATMATGFYADVVGPYCIDGSTYARVLGRAVVFDACSDKVRLFGEGESGAGTVLADATGLPTAVFNFRGDLEEIGGPWPNAGLTTSVGALSLSAGGTQDLDLDLADSLSGSTYLVAGSITGWWPGVSFGVVTGPLVPDGYTQLTVANPGATPLFGSVGVLGPGAEAAAGFALPAGSSPSFAGIVVYHAAVALGGSAVVAATNPVPLRLLP